MLQADSHFLRQLRSTRRRAMTVASTEISIGDALKALGMACRTALTRRRCSDIAYGWISLWLVGRHRPRIAP